MQRKQFRKAIVGWLIGLYSCALWAQYSVSGGAGTPFLAADDTKNDLQVYLVYGTENVEIRSLSAPAGAQWYRYRTRALEAEEIPSRTEGGVSVISGIEDGCGYFVREPGKMTRYVWIIDYRRHAFDVETFRTAQGGDPCSTLSLEGEGQVSLLSYYTPSGTRVTLPRKGEVSYRTLGWSEESFAFFETDTTVEVDLQPFGGDPGRFRVNVEAPLTDTPFTLKGDNFAAHFDAVKTIHSDEYPAVAVAVHADTTLVVNEAPNMDASSEGYSAPATLTFTARANEPVASLYIWSIFRDEEGGEENPFVRFTGEEVEYTFTEAGKYIARVEVSGPSGTCSVTEEFSIEVAESFLDVPNVFSPGMTPGINDEFRVAYKSLVRFNAWIFNRWGQELYHWNDPARGWDGKKGGKFVPPGVYFYIIEAEGSDGKKYKKKGDINILRSKTIQTEPIETY